MARFKSINDIVNQVAVETGVPPVQDVFASADPAMDQLVALANSCGYELLQDEQWQNFTRKFTINTTSADDGKYPLPADFAYMIDQTGWERTENLPVKSLSAQEWTYLQGRDLVSYTIYASFRMIQGEIWLFPYADSTQTVPDGLEVTFEYQSRNWVLDNGIPDTYADKCTHTGDIVLYEPYMFERLLKARFLEARGFDSTKANEQYALASQSWAGKDKTAPKLNGARGGFGAPYLSAYGNTPDTGYGN